MFNGQGNANNFDVPMDDADMYDGQPVIYRQMQSDTLWERFITVAVSGTNERAGSCAYVFTAEVCTLMVENPALLISKIGK